MATKGTGAVKFEAPVGTDTVVSYGVSRQIKTRLNCISLMREYMGKSLEELRFEDYLAIRKGPQQVSGGLFGSNSNTICRPFGSNDNPLNGSRNTFVSTENSSSCVKTGLFGSMVNSTPFGNTNTFGSMWNNPFSNKSIFGSPDSKSPFGNTSIFGCTDSKPPFGNTSIFGFTEAKPNFGNTSIFGSGGSKPAFGNKNMFGFAENKPYFGKNNTFTAVARTQPETQSPTVKTISTPSKMQNEPTFGIEASLFNLSSETTSRLRSPFGFTTRIKKLSTSSKSKNYHKQPTNVGSGSSSTTEASSGAEEGVLLGGTEKFNFSFTSNSKTPGPQGELILQNPASENQEEGIKKLMSDLQGLIECPVCFGILDTSLKQCENGHGICGSCFNNVEKCPTCQHAYLPYKPILLWQIIDRLPKPCSFVDKGCDKISFSREEEHETFCKFRPTSCKFPSCEWKGTVEAVTDHVKTCKKSTGNALCEIHFPNVKIDQMYAFEKTQNVSLYSAIIFENQVFWKYFHRDSSSKIISYKFYHITPTKPKKKYYLVVSFNKGEIEFKMCVAASYKTEKHSEDKKCNEISFFLPDEDLERFYDSEGKGYRYTQQIIVEDICDKKKSM